MNEEEEQADAILQLTFQTTDSKNRTQSLLLVIAIPCKCRGIHFFFLYKPTSEYSKSCKYRVFLEDGPFQGAS